MADRKNESQEAHAFAELRKENAALKQRLAALEATGSTDTLTWGSAEVQRLVAAEDFQGLKALMDSGRVAFRGGWGAKIAERIEREAAARAEAESDGGDIPTSPQPDPELARLAEAARRHADPDYGRRRPEPSPEPTPKPEAPPPLTMSSPQVQKMAMRHDWPGLKDLIDQGRLQFSEENENARILRRRIEQGARS